MVLFLILIPLIFSVFQHSPKTVYAAFNQEINYQGKLLDSASAPVADGDYSIVFRLYDDPVAGTTLWTETDTVTVTSGLFSIMLGSTTPLTGVDFNQTLYLGLNVAADGEMTPRKVLGAVPAAFEAKQLDGLATTSFLRADTLDTATGLLTFTGGIISNSSTTISELNFNTATGTTLVINSEAFTDFTGSGLTNTGGVLSTNITESNLNITGSPSDGYVLQASSTAVGGFTWQATSTLGFAAAGSDTTLSSEEVQDFVGAMTTGNTETGIAVNYQDGDGTLDFILNTTGDWTGTLDGIEGTDFALDSDIGSTIQAFDADLSTYAGITPTADTQSLLAAANYTAMRALLNLEVGTDFYSIAAADTAFEENLANEAGLYSALSDVSQFWEAGDTINSGVLALDSLSYTGTLAHEYGGLELDISSVGVGDIIAGVSAGALEIVDGGAAADGDVLMVQADGTVNFETPDAGHAAVTLAGEDYLSLSTQQITANAINADNLSSSDFGSFTCNGTTCSFDNDEGYLSSVTSSDLAVTNGFVLRGSSGNTAEATSTLFIAENGSIGIGTTSPSSQLDIWGDFRVGTSASPTFLVDTSSDSVTVNGNTLQPKLFVTVGTTDADYLIDGTADDVQIQSAIDAVSADGGGIVYLKSGIYDVTATIELETGVTLEGVGSSTRLVLADATDERVIENADISPAGNSGMTIRNMVIDGNGDNQTDDTKDAIYFAYTSDLTIDNILVKNARRHNLFVSGGSSNILVQNSRFENSITLSNIALYLVEYVRVSGNYSTGAFETGVKADSSSHFTIADNNFIGNGSSNIYVTNSQEGTVSGNSTEGALYGIRVLASDHTTFTGNSITDADNHGIAILQNVNYLTLTGNSIKNSGQASADTYDGINITDSSIASSYLTISGNIIADDDGTPTMRHAVYSDNNSDNLTIVGNTFYGAQSESVNIVGSSNLVFANHGDTSEQTIWRDEADSKTALVIQQTNAGSSGNILALRNNSATTTVFTRTGNVGIGTTTPTAELDIYDSGFANLAITGGTSAALQFFELDQAADEKKWQIRATDGDLIFQAVNDAGSGGGDSVKLNKTGNSVLGMSFLDNGTVTNFISNSGDSYFESGNVGIGTTTPTHTLTVDGDAMVAGALYDSAYNPGVSGYVLQTTGTGTQWVATSSLGLSSEIGSDTLDFTDFADAMTLDTTTSVEIGGFSYTQNVGAGNYVINLEGLGDFAIQDNGNAHATFANNGNITMGSNNEFFIDSVAGEVGILNAIPDYTLDVNGTVGVNEYIYHNNDPDTYLRFTDDRVALFAGDDIAFSATEDATPALNFGTVWDYAFNTDALFVGGTEGSYDGLVGIGDTTPSAQLNIGAGNASTVDGVDDLFVTDDIEIDGSLYVASASIFDGNVTASRFIGQTDSFAVLRSDTHVYIELDADNDGAGQFIIRDGAATGVFSINESGQVTTGEWNGTEHADAYVSDTLTIGSGSTIAGDAITDGTIDQSEIADDILDFVDLADAMTLDAATSIDVASNYIFNLSSTADFFIQDAGVNQHIFFDTGDVRLGNNNEVYVQTSGNNVGIATSTPTYRLTVEDSLNGYVALFSNGSANANSDGIIIEAGGASPATTAKYITMTDGAGVIEGHIQSDGSGGISLNSISDERLKENIVNTDFGLGELLEIQVRDFNFISGSTTITGFVAQELWDVYPLAVSQPEDLLTSPQQDPWTVAESRLIPLLTASIQDMATILDLSSASTTQTALTVTSNGNIAIGTSTATAQLTTDGSVRFATFGAGSLSTDADGNLMVSSDERLKNITNTFNTGLDAILEIEPINYKWLEETGFDSEGVYTGFSAQNVQLVIPEAVGEDKHGFLTLSDRPILAAVVNAVQEIWEELLHTNTKVDNLEIKNAQLESRLETLEEALNVETTPTPEENEPEPVIILIGTSTEPIATSTLPTESAQQPEIATSTVDGSSNSEDEDVTNVDLDISEENFQNASEDEVELEEAVVEIEQEVIIIEPEAVIPVEPPGENSTE